MTPTEHHAFLSMLALADASTGTWRGSAPALRTILGYSRKNTIAEALDGLEAKGYILRDYAPGKRGNFPIVIDKFLLTWGINAGKRIDLAATKHEYRIPKGRLDKLKRKPLFASIAAACSHPVLVSETDSGSDGGSDSGVRTGSVSILYTREGVSEGGSEGFAHIPNSTSGFAGQEENPESPSIPESAAERSAPVHPQGSPVRPVPPVQPAPPSAFSAAPTPQMSLPEQLATQFFGYQGRPAKFDNPVSFNLWVSAFTRLIDQHGYDPLLGAMNWAFNVDSFWPPHLIRADDPLGYFEQKLAEQILPRFFGWKAGEANKSKASINKKEGNYDRQQPRPGVKPSGKQPVDNTAAAAEAKRRLRERLGA